jgi:hypothetical protein
MLIAMGSPVTIHTFKDTGNTPVGNYPDHDEGATWCDDMLVRRKKVTNVTVRLP